MITHTHPLKKNHMPDRHLSILHDSSGFDWYHIYSSGIYSMTWGKFLLHAAIITDVVIIIKRYGFR